MLVLRSNAVLLGRARAGLRRDKFACLPLLELYGWIESDTESQDTTAGALGVHGGDDEASQLASGASSNNLVAMPADDAAAAR